MSALTDLIYAGSNAVAGLTEGDVNDAIAKHGADTPVAFPDTAYFFPTIYAATGVKVKTLGDLPACVGVLKSLITNQDDIGAALNAGLATAVGAEIIEGLKYVDNANPYEADSGIGFVPDPIIRSLGVPLVTGDIPGVAVVLGKADDPAAVAKVVKDYQSKGILTFMIGDCIEQAAGEGVKMGLELRVVPLGHDVTSVIHVVTVAIRAALIFGNVFTFIEFMLEVAALLMPCDQFVLILTKLAFDHLFYQVDGDIHIIALLLRADDIALHRNGYLNLLAFLLHTQGNMNLCIRSEISLQLPQFVFHRFS